MRSTPPIPRFIRDFAHPAYVNVYERLPNEPRLFGTETLYGDWDADVLLLAQDCGLVAALDARIAQGHPTPHGHGAGLPTNVKLERLARQLPQPKLYGSAMGSLWRRDGSKRGKPPEWDMLLHAYVIPMLRWVVRESRFNAVACLGEFAWEAFMTAAGQGQLARDWQRCRDLGQQVDAVIEGRQIRAFAMYHPGNPRGYDVLGRNWPALATYLLAKSKSNSPDAQIARTVAHAVEVRTSPLPLRSQRTIVNPSLIDRYDLPAGAKCILPPHGVPRPIDLTKSRSPRFRRPVLVALTEAGRAGLTEDRCGLVAYPSDEPEARLRKQRAMIRNIAHVDGHVIVELPGKRVALACFFRAASHVRPR